MDHLSISCSSFGVK